MTERALSEEAMLASLRDIWLPAEAAGGVFAEIAAAVSLAACAALIVAAALRMVSTRVPVKRSTEPDPLAALDEMPEHVRRLVLLQQLRAQHPERYVSLTQTLYQRGGAPEVATLEAEICADD